MKVADAAGSQAGDGDSTSASKLGKRLVSSGGGGNIPGMSPIPIPFMITLMLQIFSIIFFSQLILGVVGLEKLLMTGKLHLPVPALIAAGPLFRGTGFFMAILFTFSVLLVGPAWCSWLCYIGAWDNYAAKFKKIPISLHIKVLRIVCFFSKFRAANGLSKIRIIVE